MRVSRYLIESFLTSTEEKGGSRWGKKVEGIKSLLKSQSTAKRRIVVHSSQLVSYNEYRLVHETEKISKM